MSYVIAATYVVRDGEAEGVQAALEKMIGPTRAEPGCISYDVHRSLDDGDVFFLFERYRDEEAFAAHASSEHYERHVKGEAWPRLERREVVRARPLTEQD